MQKNNIFINCPFDDEYRPMLKVLLFTCAFYGLKPRMSPMRSAYELNRLERIQSMMMETQYSVHDLSRMRAMTAGEFCRMNMPFELGLDYGMNKNNKCLLVFEGIFRGAQKALSDIKSWDVHCHDNNPQKLISEFRSWWYDIKGKIDMSSAMDIWYKYNDFQVNYEAYKKEHKIKSDKEISFVEYCDLVETFLRKEAI